MLLRKWSVRLGVGRPHSPVSSQPVLPAVTPHSFLLLHQQPPPLAWSPGVWLSWAPCLSENLGTKAGFKSETPTN